ncbi:MAG: GGDEF domain-containing protein [Elusimicrobia bacterium]|nr:GGDEF domain-containing protein [Elusimicrobiota bacterium]
MERMIIFLPLLVIFTGYNFGIGISRMITVISLLLAIFFYPSYLYLISVITSLGLTIFFLEAFYKQLLLIRRTYNEKLNKLVNELGSVKKDSETARMELVKNEKTIKNILHIYEISKDISSHVNFENMFNLITQSLHSQFIIKDVTMKIFDNNRIFKKGTPINIDENIKTQKVADGAIQIPMLISEKSIGIISARIPPQYEKDNEFFDAMAAFVEELKIAIQRAILYSRVEMLSRTDGLTGLYRRGYFNERLKEEEFRARRWRGKFSILMMDIDHFKKVNDTYGHQAGDTVLKTVAEILKNSIYETDFAARYGGEEFVTIFPQTDPAGLVIKAEKIRKAIEEAEITVGLEKLRVTSSFGIAHYPKDGDTGDEVLRKADMSLYKSKQTGRNKITEFNKKSDATD